LRQHGGDPEAIRAVSIDMSPAYIKGVAEHLPNAASPSTSSTSSRTPRTRWTSQRRPEQKRDPALKGLRWALLKDPRRLSDARRADLDALLAHLTTKRTARAWQYREDLREILSRKQINVVRAMLRQWCTNVMRSKVEPMKTSRA
jgi:transposase